MSFKEMHVPGQPFILANAWDIGSARMLVAMGAKAVGTSSAGFAFTRGVGDYGQVSRDAAIDHGGELAAHLPVPVSADLEDGYGPTPAACAEAIEASVAAGLAGCCFEDVAPDLTAYAFDDAVARVEASALAAPDGFVFCARADGVMQGLYDLDEAIRRLQAFHEAGADLLYCPVPGSAADLKRLVDAVDGPVNALAVGPLASLSLADFAEIGVARISVGAALARATHRVIQNAGGAMLGGDFTQLGGVSGDAIDGLLAQGTPATQG
jgi:2-methylisocitrate lyase-like PEP mutase family enzyme